MPVPKRWNNLKTPTRHWKKKIKSWQQTKPRWLRNGKMPYQGWKTKKNPKSESPSWRSKYWQEPLKTESSLESWKISTIATLSWRNQEKPTETLVKSLRNDLKRCSSSVDLKKMNVTFLKKWIRIWASKHINWKVSWGMFKITCSCRLRLLLRLTSRQWSS